MSDYKEEEGELPIIVELPKILLAQGLSMKSDQPVEEASLAFDTAGFDWDGDSLWLDLTFDDKNGVRLGAIRITPMLNEEHSILIGVEMDVDNYVTSATWTLPESTRNHLEEAAPKAYALCKDDPEALAEISHLYAHLEHLQKELESLQPSSLS